MREPVRDVSIEQQPEPMPGPAVSLLPGRRLEAPDARFVADLCTAIRAGARPQVAAAWLGVGKKQWKLWRSRSGGVYDELRDGIRAAVAHLEVRLQADLAKRSPGAALKGLRRVRDDDEPEPSRRYDQSGVNTIKRALPDLLRRIDDPAITDLTPVESAAREWKENVVRDLGGSTTITATKLALVISATGSWIMLSTIDRYILDLAATQGLVSRKHRKAWPVVETRARLAESFARQLQMIGLEKQSAPPMDLNRYIAERYGSNGDVAAPEPQKEPD